METDVGAAIANRAINLVGVPFRMRGRSPECGLDCVGVVAQALECTGMQFDVPRDYAFRGEYLGRISAFFGSGGFRSIDCEPAQPGDILMYRSADRQVHFGVDTSLGAVHAHAGLGRVVLTPKPMPWPVIAHWRFTGD